MGHDDSRLLSIGEAAKSLHITRRILLNYEDKGLLHPDVKEGASGNRDYPLDDPNQVSFCVAVPQSSRGEFVEDWPAEKAVCIFFYGDYDEIPQVREDLLAYARENGLRLKGSCRNIYLEGPPHHTGKSKFVTQVAMPIE